MTGHARTGSLALCRGCRKEDRLSSVDSTAAATESPRITFYHFESVANTVKDGRRFASAGNRRNMKLTGMMRATIRCTARFSVNVLLH